MLIPSTHTPATSLPIAITDAIGTPKSYCNLMPHVRDLIQPHIKNKREMLLDWLDPFITRVERDRIVAWHLGVSL